MAYQLVQPTALRAVADERRSVNMKRLLPILALIHVSCWAKLEKSVSTSSKPQYVAQHTTWSRDGIVILKTSIADRGEKGVLSIDTYWADGKQVYMVIRDGPSINRVVTGSEGLGISEVDSPVSSEVGLLITSKVTGFVEFFVGEGFRTPSSDSELALKKEQLAILSTFSDAVQQGDADKMRASFDKIKNMNAIPSPAKSPGPNNKTLEPTAPSGRGSP